MKIRISELKKMKSAVVIYLSSLFAALSSLVIGGLYGDDIAMSLKQVLPSAVQDMHYPLTFFGLPIVIYATASCVLLKIVSGQVFSKPHLTLALLWLSVAYLPSIFVIIGFLTGEH